MKLAFYFALRDTVVADSLDQASRIAYGKDKRWGRVVTVKVRHRPSSVTGHVTSSLLFLFLLFWLLLTVVWVNMLMMLVMGLGCGLGLDWTPITARAAYALRFLSGGTQ